MACCAWCIELDGEVIQRADPHIGLLHRATEKLAESKPYSQNIGYMDRLDYVSMMCNGTWLCAGDGESCLGVEPFRFKGAVHSGRCSTKLHGFSIIYCGSPRTRLDIGAMTVFLYCFREREDLIRLLRGGVRCARMHATYYRVGAASTAIFRRFHASLPTL